LVNKTDLVKELNNILLLIENDLYRLSEYLYLNPETSFEESKSVDVLCSWLEDNNFFIKRGENKLSTAFIASSDRFINRPSVGFIAEYDALPEIGHACGHNLISAMSLGAAVSTNLLLKKYNLKGTSVVIGTPAEEAGGGKILMIKEGFFDNLDCVMMIHPSNKTMVEDFSLARVILSVRYYGEEAHASAYPWQGKNAHEAALQTFNLINGFRGQLKDFSRINGGITKGIEATNVIPKFIEVKYDIRSNNSEYLDELVKIVTKCAKNAADTFDVKVEILTEDFKYEPVKNNRILEELLGKYFRAVGESVEPKGKEDGLGSTDMGNVTIKLPSIHAHIKIKDGLRTHTTEFGEACVGVEGKKALLKGVKVLTLTAIDVIKNPSILKEMWKIHATNK